ncbi:hypothetical protein RDV64_22655 [Acuticoccus sp. MNP-M23]|uniref:hypothetical protein n=1 Tax=Acuticoccus sp. MNP-M23 TaxID=3072793 RepID=UPI0028163F4D|nr:hypothetical protein [Acuticoccus sp. MNP-M23]WMS42820.1 hypothetical protein RDV64_22655 [Acuticoccus sp. MNP-M23]
MSQEFTVHQELTRTFRFYIALTVFANLGYGLMLGVFFFAATAVSGPASALLLIPPAMVSTGFAALSAFGVAEAFGLHRAIQSTGTALALPHITRSMMLPVQTTLTLIFHALFAFLLFGWTFFALIGVLPTPAAWAG